MEGSSNTISALVEPLDNQSSGHGEVPRRLIVDACLLVGLVGGSRREDGVAAIHRRAGLLPLNDSDGSVDVGYCGSDIFHISPRVLRISAHMHIGPHTCRSFCQAAVTTGPPITS